MCGIIGYIGQRPIVPVLMESLRRLEYRGYDSAGIAVVRGGRMHILRSVGKIGTLEKALEKEPIDGDYGVGHTRWATHGRPSEENAHPHTDCTGEFVIVHNGIIENYLALKSRLKGKHAFKTETDSEVIVHLIEDGFAGNLEEAVANACRQIEGIYAFAVISLRDPGKIVATRNGPPLVIGVGSEEYFVSSDLPAILPYTRDIIYLEEHETSIVTSEGVKVLSPQGLPKTVEMKKIHWDPILIEKGGYKHFMLKEIHEQPRAIRDSIAGRFSLDRGEVGLDELGLSGGRVQSLQKINILACGTAWHASLVGKFLLEKLARIPVEVDYASEFRYRDPIVSDRQLTVVVTQSGETADTLAALRESKARGARTAAICNVEGSLATREAHATLLTHAGPEIGVASTKAFTSQLAVLFLLAVYIGRERRVLGEDQIQPLLEALTRIPHQIETILSRENGIQDLARHFFTKNNFLFLGRGINYPIALEGALKLKEISYIHAEGYPAGEMKHGPIALIGENLPVVAIAPRDETRDKMAANIEEVKARDGVVIAVTTEGNEAIARRSDYTFFVPETLGVLTPILNAVPLQLLAYHIAERRGCDVDQPRNLAKSVTVE
jgi:glucosamine--fructose-6-phosphate aminotransferase (isomerizing)